MIFDKIGFDGLTNKERYAVLLDEYNIMKRECDRFNRENMKLRKQNGELRDMLQYSIEQQHNLQKGETP